MSLTNNKVDVRAVFQHISRRKIAGIQKKNLSVAKKRPDPFNQIFMIVGLNIDNNQLALADSGKVTGYVFDPSRGFFLLFKEMNHTVILQQMIKVFIIHGVRCLNKIDLVALQAQLGRYRRTAVTGT